MKKFTLTALALLGGFCGAQAQGTAFTYQGRLNDGGSPANGFYDLVFTVYDSSSGPNVLAGPLTNSATAVSNGLFVVLLDFGPGVVTGSSTWLGIGARTNGAGAFATLSPRQQLTPAPYAIFAEGANAAGLRGTIASTNIAGGSITSNLLATGSVTAAQLAPGIGVWTQTSSNLYYTGSPVGIGTVAPGKLLQVGDNTTPGSEGMIRLGSRSFTGGTANSLWEIGVPQTGDDLSGVGYDFVINDTQSGKGPALTIRWANGFVGIGNTNPQTTLEVGGNISVDQNLVLPATTAAAGVIYAAGAPLIHSYGLENFFAGSHAGNFSMTGADNTGVGSYALYSNTSGSDNTANGNSALYSNSIGFNNTADGYWALVNNTNGSYNTAGGWMALFANSSGGVNTAYGAQALQYNTTGHHNTACGVQALGFNTNGIWNTAHGFAALYLNTSGSRNTACGYEALSNNKATSDNIALGYLAGSNPTNGSFNICIGSPGVDKDTSTIRIGSSQTNTFIAGIFGATAAVGAAVLVTTNGQLGTLTSSRRFKENIQPMGDASDVLLALRPVTFRYKPEVDPAGVPQSGLVAEEVAQVDPDLVLRDQNGQPYSVRYEQVNAMLLNEFLKEHRKIEAQNSRIQALEQSLADLKAAVEKLGRR